MTSFSLETSVDIVTAAAFVKDGHINSLAAY